MNYNDLSDEQKAKARAAQSQPRQRGLRTHRQPLR